MNLRYLLMFSILMSAPKVLAKDIRAKDTAIHGNYLFIESERQADLLTIVGKTETVVVSQSENTTTRGEPIRSWVISTRWIDDPVARRSALAQAISAHPEWENFAKDREDVTSDHCSFLLDDPDIKVGEGNRSTPLTSSSVLCTYVVHTKNDGDQKLLAAIEQNNLIDSGLKPLKIRYGSTQHTIVDARDLSRSLDAIGLDSRKTYSERDAAIYLGLAFVRLTDDMDPQDAQDVLSLPQRSELMSALNQAFDRLYHQESLAAKQYRYQPMTTPSPITVQRYQSLIFNPQLTETP